MGDTCKWNATIDAFLLNHDPSRLMDFYQIFDQVPEGVNTTQNSNPEGVPIGPPVGIVSRQRKRVAGFRQESIWSRFIHYLVSMGNTDTSTFPISSSHDVIKAVRVMIHC
jgi:hypothetical protein